MCRDVQVHLAACPERARQRDYAKALHARYDKINTVIFPTVELILEDVPVEDEPDLSDVESERPRAIPDWEMSLTMARVFSSGAQPSPLDWARICTWWLMRQHGLLRDADAHHK